MARYSENVRDSILVYLRQEFSNFIIDEESQNDSYCFRLTNENNSYFVRVMYTAIEAEDLMAIVSQLERLSVADTMRGLGDFPVVVTDCGCIFGSP